ncbi:MAG TPA: O-antigen ligase family protein [Candidatus Acidoferrales bacterium]|jgi:O-antigen ligase|nr:O-antigen ligase family protein [Candidatus Acidoferrales bacterium]
MRPLRIGICLVIVFAVLASGVVETWSESVMEIAVAGLLLWWAFGVARGRGTEVRWCPVLWPLLALALFGAAQLAFHITVYPYLTKLELLRVASYVLLLFLSLQAFRNMRHWQAFGWFILWFGFAVAVFAILQDLTFNGKIYWFRELPFGGVPFGPFVNRNHFAGFIELIVPMGLAFLAVRGMRRDQLPLVGLCTALPVGALILSASRGGIFSFGAELIVLVLLLLLCGAQKRQLLAGLLVLGVAAALVSWLGFSQVLKRFSEVHNPEVTEARRIAMAGGAWHIFLDHAVTGTGLGTIISVFPRYDTAYDAKVVDHVHNDHLELLAETGAVGGACWAAFLLLLFGFGVLNIKRSRDPLARAVHLAALVACAGLLVHGLMDFNLHIPSNALLFYVMAGMATAVPDPSPTIAQPPPRWR